jgi:hypothetical protein
MRRSILMTCAIVVGFGLVVLFVQQTRFDAWDFRNNLWGPAHLLVNGDSPYDLALMNFELGNAVWLPGAIGTFFWLGFFSQAHATSLWWLIMIGSLLGSLYLALPDKKPPLLWTAYLLLLTGFFPPVLAHMSLGQYTFVAMFCLLVSVRLLEQDKIWLAGLLLAIASAKPQLLVLPVFGMLLYMWWYRGWRVLLTMLLAWGVSSLVLTIPLWFGSLDWPLHLLQNLQSNPSWQHPSLAQALEGSIGQLSAVVYGLVLAGTLLLNAALWLARPARVALMWSMALNPLVVLYIWHWDFVMMLPLLAYTLVSGRWSIRVFLALACGVIWGLAMYIQITSGGNSFLFWWIPYALLPVIGFSRWQYYR